MTLAAHLRTSLAERYVIERELGTGGMATVFLAHDVRHDRKVAVKVLKPELAAVLGAERFLVEIKTTASLQHPHILPLFDSGEANGMLYYVMPYVEGETIREKLNRESQFSVDEAIRVAREVADALDYAHRHGVIHRDIKPENILLHDGRAMVMDFGIALALSAAAGGRMTETGLSLGTPHYMSPEQATAEKDLTPRTDVYSLACVLYEMLAGNPPHIGGTAQQIIMRILTDTPRPVADLRKSVPPNVSAALARSLEKLPADRFESARAFGDALATSTFTYLTTSGGTATRPADHTSTPLARARRVQWVFAGVAGAALFVAAWSWLRPTPPPPLTRLDLVLSAPLSGNDIAISPDGSTIAYAGAVGTSTAIYVRHLDSESEFRMIPGTDGGAHPAFSPDSKWILFHRDRGDGSLVRMSTTGGAMTTLLTNPDAHNAHWGTANQIVYGGPSGIYVIPATGGQPKQLNGLGGRRLFLLPDGSGVLGQSSSDVVLYDLRTDSVITLIPKARQAIYLKSGYLLFNDEQGGASAVRFDLAKHRVIGSPVRVLDRVAANVSARGFAVADNGTLLQHEGVGSSLLGGTRFVIQTLDGKSADTIPLPPGRRLSPRFSPNGRSIVYQVSMSGNVGDIYTYDLVSGTNTQVTFGGRNIVPAWSPDGSRIVFARDSAQVSSLRVKRADNSAPEEVLLTGAANELVPSAWPREDLILFTKSAAGQPSQLLTIAPKAGSTPQPYLTAPWNELDAVLSPDGRLAAFVARETSAMEIWLREFPTPVGKWKVSSSGGNSPRWSVDGRYIYYWKAGPADSLFRVQVDRTPSVVVHAPEVVGGFDISGTDPLDFHPDGKRFIIAANDVGLASGPTSTTTVDRYLVVLNWVNELTNLVKAAPK